MSFLISAGNTKSTQTTSRLFRINPMVQPGGCANLQYSNFLAHGNPCGNATLVSLPVGTGVYSFTTIRQVLAMMQEDPGVQKARDLVSHTGSAYVGSNPTNGKENFVKYLQALNDLGVALDKSLPPKDKAPEGYHWRVSVYDSSGCTYYDSLYPDLQTVKDGVQTFVTLTPNNPLQTTSTALYGLSLTPCYLQYIDPTVGNQAQIVNSAYCVNQNAFPESIFATATLLVGLSSQKSFPNAGFGYGARQNINGSLTYAVAYYSAVLSQAPLDMGPIALAKFVPSIIDVYFVRLSLEQDFSFGSS